MATEIIKTENPNIVIERTVVEKEINISQIHEKILGIENEILILSAKKNELDSVSVPEFLRDIVDRELSKILGEIYSCEEERTRLNKLLV